MPRAYLAKEPASWEGHFLLGSILFRQGHAAESLNQNQPDEAVSMLKQAQAIAPEDPRVPELLGKALWRQNKFEDARTQLEEAVRLLPGSAADHYLLGQVYRKLGLAEKAKSELELAAALSTPRDSRKN